MKYFYVDGNVFTALMKEVFERPEILEQIKDNFARAKKKCRGCIYLHLGRHVAHNHCDISRDDWSAKCPTYLKQPVYICDGKNCQVLRDVKDKTDDILQEAFDDTMDNVKSALTQSKKEIEDC